LPKASPTSTRKIETPVRIPTSTPIQISSPTKKSQLEPEDFIRDYFYSVTHKRNYEHLWTLMTDDFKQRNTPGGYSEYIEFWNTVEQVDINNMEFQRTSDTSVKCQFRMILHIGGKQYFTNAKYNLIYDASRQTWLFD
jgi:hypothetical protein